MPHAWGLVDGVKTCLRCGAVCEAECSERFALLKELDEAKADFVARVKQLADVFNDTTLAFEHRVESAEEELRWLRQTVHQAHHEGPIGECPKATCQARPA
jgi:hypothetical protein